MEQKTDIIYSDDKNKYICALCECDQNDHLIFWKCPLFENELICQSCCHIEMLYDDIDSKVSARIGKEVSKEFINKTCNDCGKNCAKQNEQVAHSMEQGKGDFDAFNI